MGITKLTMYCEHVGCTAKINAQILEQIVNLWKVDDNDSVKSGLAERDDVGCYDLGNGRLLLHNLDVITPVLDDAFAFGNIAVSHVLSDIYAKGGTPISALSLLGIPLSIMSSFEEIIAGCSAKLNEAGVVLLGGHTISSYEPLVGFSVTGTIERGSIVSLKGARNGDKLILTKPIGSGIISTAVKFSNLGVDGATVTDEELSIVTRSMESLNSQASKVMMNYHANACTDVTGFGLAGHISNLVRASGVGARIYYHLVPKVPGVTRLFQHGITPARLDENIRYYYHDRVSIVRDVDVDWPILFCPETSGGLLIAINENYAEQLIDSLNEKGVVNSAIIGEVFNDLSCKVMIYS
jgi:selenium donor protein